jgi:predicted anti-sigma-YlaC factor YlaD
MHCEQAGEMMSARLDGRLGSAEMALLEEHLVGCGACRAEWRRLQALNHLLVSTPKVRAPAHLCVRVMARLRRREQARRAIIGGTTLTLGTVALALLALAPLLLHLLDTTGIAPALVRGGPETIVQLLALLEAIGRALLVLVDKCAVPLISLSLFSLMIALALNRLWVGAVRRARAAH